MWGGLGLDEFFWALVIAYFLQVSIVNANHIGLRRHLEKSCNLWGCGWKCHAGELTCCTQQRQQWYIPTLCYSWVCFRNPLWVRNGTHKSSERLLSQLTMRRGFLSWSVIDPKCHSQHVALYCAWTMFCWCCSKVTLSAKYVPF